MKKRIKHNEVIQEVLEGKNIKQVAGDMGVSKELLYKWKSAEARNPLGHIEELFKATGEHRIIEYMCTLFDGYFVSNTHELEEHENVNRIYSEIADVLKVMSESYEDEVFTLGELLKIQREFNELQAVMHGFLASQFKRFELEIN